MQLIYFKGNETFSSEIVNFDIYATYQDKNLNFYILEKSVLVIPVYHAVNENTVYKIQHRKIARM